MKPQDLRQALNVRTLRAEKAERALRDARATEEKARGAVQMAQAQLAAFDDALDARISAFYAKAAVGIAPESLHSARAFHSDLRGQRQQMETLIVEAQEVLAVAEQRSEEARAVWAQADAAARKLQDMVMLSETKARRVLERRAEHDADEIAVARARSKWN